MTTHRDAVETLAAERYLLGEMSEAERHEFEAHYFTCAECAEDMRVAERLRSEAAAVFAPARDERSQSGRVLRWRPLRSAALPWAVAASLALVAVYTGYTGSDAGQPQALSPVALRPATRGAVQNVALSDRDAVVALALDVNIGTEGSDLAYRVLREDGTSVAAGGARVPSPGTPLLLLIPARHLHPGGPFVVRLAPRNDAGTPPAEYRFNAVVR